KNIDKIAGFLNECRLVGYEGENNKADNSSYIIGAEGISIISSYLADKPKNQSSHQIQVIKNTNLITSYGSKKHINIFLEQNQIHNGLKDQLTEDLKEAKDSDFNKTYIVEAFGTTGGNHFVALTIRKNKNEKSPLIDLFDPSNSIFRNGLEA